jgi:large subunit ribosomal protein L6
MIRKSSYFLIIPVNIQVKIHKQKYTALWIKGPLGIIRTSVVFPAQFTLKDQYLEWTLVPSNSKRERLQLITYNNNLKKHLFNIFNHLNSPEVCLFKLVGRGYKITSSKNKRIIALELGFTNKKIIPLPSFINVRVISRYSFELTSLNLPYLRAFAKKIRALRLPNPYTSKGIFLNNETVISKQGKSTQY